jgi:hypothetical protein
VKRQPATRSERPIGEDGSPGSILAILDSLATPIALRRLLDLAERGRADTSLRVCRGATWTNVAQRSLYLLQAVVSELGVATPPVHLQRIKGMRAIGVNWVYGPDDSPEGHALFNYGTFEFDTAELRREAARLLEAQAEAESEPRSRRPAQQRAARNISSRLRRIKSVPADGEHDSYEAAAQLEDVIEEQQHALRRDPTAAEPYRALHKLYLHRDEFDRAWCACQALFLLGKAGDEEQRFYDEHRPPGLLTIKSRLDSAQWKKHLYHPEENAEIGAIFEALAPLALVLKIHLLRESNQLSVMDERFKQDPKGSTVTLAKTFGWAADVFGIRRPELYVRSDLPGALVAVPTRPPASLAGSTVCSGLKPQELSFVVGKHMSFYRADHYVKCLFPDLSELTALFSAALDLAGMGSRNAGARAREFRRLLEHIEMDRMGAVKQAVHRWAKSGAPADIERWSRSVEMTAGRAGLVLSGDLRAAWTLTNAEAQPADEIAADDKVKDLFAFAVSPGYFALRTLLGVAIS